MVETEIIPEIMQDQSYRLGERPVMLFLPRLAQCNPDGRQITFDPGQNHRRYLYDSNLFPIKEALDEQGGIYARKRVSDGREIIVAATSSPYTTEGDHLILWLLRGNNFQFQPTVEDVSEEQGREAFSLAGEIVSCYQEKDPSGKWFIGVNYNEGEDERQSVQSIRDGVHIHLVRIDQGDISRFKPARDGTSRHLFADSFTPLSLEILQKVAVPEILKDGDFSRIKPFARQLSFSYPKAYFFALPYGRETLKEEWFFRALVGMNRVLRQKYQELTNCFIEGRLDMFRAQVGGEMELFQRPKLRPRREIYQNLERYFDFYPQLASEKNLRRFFWLAENLRNASEVVDREKSGSVNGGVPVIEAERVNSQFILKGLSCNLLIFPNQESPEEVFMAVVPRVTSGGSPLDAFGIRKVQYEVSLDEFQNLTIKADRRRDKIVGRLLEQNPTLEAGPAFEGRPLF